MNPVALVHKLAQLQMALPRLVLVASLAVCALFVYHAISLIGCKLLRRFGVPDGI
jgi:hypothetical protein